MKVDPLVRGLIRGSELRHLGIPHNHATKADQFLDVVGAVLVVGVEFSVFFAYHGGFGPRKLEDVFQGEAGAGKRALRSHLIVESTRHRDFLPHTVLAHGTDGAKPVRTQDISHL